MDETRVLTDAAQAALDVAAGKPAPARERETIGWAVVDNGDIKVRTVSDTRRAAIVNWLVAERLAFIHAAMTDEHIERIWFQYRGDEVEVEYVTITRTHTRSNLPR